MTDTNSRLRDRIDPTEISTRSMWQFVGVILATVLALWAISAARGLVSMLVISFFFGLALQPAVDRLHRRYGWRRGAAVGVVYLVLAAFVVFMVLVLIPAITELANRIGTDGAKWLGSVNDWASDTFGIELFSGGAASDVATRADEVISDWAGAAFGTLVGIASSGIGLVFSGATIAMFTFYFAADAPRIQRTTLSLFTPDTQRRLGWTWDEAVTQTGGYFYSRTILMIITGIGFFFTMVLVGVPVSLSIPLSVFAGFVSVFIPAIGTYIGAAIPILVTLALQGLVPAMIVVGFALVYQQIENYWLEPKISAHSMELNGGVAFGAALAGGAIAGPMGAFMALPIAALLTSFISNFADRYEVVYEKTDPHGDDPETSEAVHEAVTDG
jgi:predicted PurR-regulated permease PerM